MSSAAEFEQRFEEWYNLHKSEWKLDPYQKELIRIMTEHEYKDKYIHTQPLPDELFVI